MSKNVRSILESLSDHDESEKFEDLCSTYNVGNSEKFSVDGHDVEIENLDGYGGEGKGDTYWVVFKVTVDNEEPETWRRNGWYASYNGEEWEGWEQVKSVEVIKTEWRAV